MASKYVDTTAIMQVIGCVYNNPQILDATDKYTLVDEDFPDIFHKTVFGAIYKIHELGAGAVTLSNISYQVVPRVMQYTNRIREKNGYLKSQKQRMNLHLNIIIND